MATKSILKDITINTKSMGRAFAEALENAHSNPGKTVTFSRKCTELKGDEAKSFLSRFKNT